MNRSSILLLALFAPGCFSPDVTDAELVPLPEQGFLFYTGTGDEAGDLYSGFTELTHVESGKVCVLVPMIHLAEAAFYGEVQQEIDRADVVLVEGVRGTPSLAPLLGLSKYILSNYPRFSSHLGLTQQGEAVEWRDNWKNADVQWSEWQSEMPWWSPLSQTLMAPFMVLFYEPGNLAMWLGSSLRGLIGDGDSFHAGARHALARLLTEEDEDELEVLLPGVIEYRNQRLLERFDQEVERDGVRRVAMPWGAAHFDGFLDAMRERGYEPTGHRWVPAITVRSLLKGEAGPEAFDLMIPYLVHWRDHRTSWSLDLLFRSIAVESRAGDSSSFELLWELLFAMNSNGGSDTFDLQLLPSLFGRPILFEYDRIGEQTRYRFLWLFEIGELD